MSQDLFVDMLIDCLALRQELTVDDVWHIEEGDQSRHFFQIDLVNQLRPKTVCVPIP